MVELTREPIALNRLIEHVKMLESGAVVTFCGDVRREGPPDNPLVALEYAAHEKMTLEKMREMREQVLKDYEVSRIAIVHRLGRLEPGETSVAVAVSAPHRDAAFRACRFVIDTLKTQVPIWKKEIRADGATTWAQPARGPAKT